MDLTIRILGLEELKKKLNGAFLVQPEIGPALDTVAKRGARGGKGLGAQNNPIGVSAQPLSRVLSTPLNFPRTRGTSWLAANLRRFLPAVARNALNKAARGITARWAS